MKGVYMTFEELKDILIKESERDDARIDGIDVDEHCPFITVWYDNDEGIAYQYEREGAGWNVYSRLITPGTTWSWSDAMYYE